jgi:glycosyltransferase involved in cell wall biosynthesis
MRICAVVKYPPIQGGVSALSYRLTQALGAAGHQVSVVTNADEVEADYRMWMRPADRDRLEAEHDNGGSVRVVPTNPLGRKLAAHIPQDKLFVTKLAALAVEEIRRIDADVVFSYYLEPYGVAAHLAAQWTGVPHVTQHAGSDRTRLLAHPDMSAAYKEVLRAADAVVANPGTIEGFGVEAARVCQLRPAGLPAAFTDPDTPVLDLDATVAAAAAAAHPWVTNTAPLPTDRATFGIYGKLSEYKGSYDLLAALAAARTAGHDFNLVVMSGGYQRERYLAAIEAAGLSERTWTLPFLPHWRVPEFLRALTAACFLERRFPVAIHTPGIPREVLTVGTCLVMSREVADKQRFRDALRQGENAYVVEEPSDVAELSGILGAIAADPAAARVVGKAGQELMTGAASDRGLAAAYEELFAAAIARRAAPPAPAGDADWLLLRRYMPATMAVAAGAPVLAGVAPGEPARRAYAAAGLLVDWVREHAAGLPAGAVEAAEFERDLLWIHLDLESRAGGLLFPRRGAAAMLLSDPVVFTLRRPVAANGLRLRRFRADIEDLLAALRAGTPYQAPAGPEVAYLFVKRGDLGGLVKRLTPAAERLLSLCDGATPVAQMQRLLGEEHGIAPDALTSLLHDLAVDRVVLM